MSEACINQKRTAIVYFGATKQDYLSLIQEKRHSALLEYIQPLLKAQLKPEKDYWVLSKRSRFVAFAAKPAAPFLRSCPVSSCVTGDKMQTAWESCWR